MSEEKAEIKKQEDPTVENKTTAVRSDEEPAAENASEHAEMSLEALIEQMNQYSESDNIFSISNKAEEVRAIFYQKLKQISKENTVKDIWGPEKEKKTSTLHPLEVEFRKAYNKLKREKAKARKKKEQEEEGNLQIKKQIIEDIDKLTNQQESLKKTFEQFRALQEKWRNTGHVPIAQNNSLWQSYHHHVELFYDYIKINNDLRDLDFKRNLEEKTKICEKAEALINEKSLNKMHDNLQELHEHWKDIGPVEKEKREDIWERFQAATKVIHKKRNDYFLEKKEENDKKLETKNDLCKQIKQLTENPADTHKQWQNLIIKCRALEDTWKAVGRLNKKDNKIAWNNLRESLNHFYQTKNTFYKNRKSDTEKVIQQKLSICEKAEELKDSTDWKNTTQQLIKLQEDWGIAGYSPKQKTDKIWKRFNSASNTFFNARKKHFKALDVSKEKNHLAKQQLLKEIEKFKSSENGKSDFEMLSNYSKKWKDCGAVPLKKQKIEKEFETVMNKHLDAIKMNKNEISKEKFKNKITAINGNKTKLDKEKSFILSKIDQQKQIIAQYENNISFFGKSKSNEALKQEVMGKIESAESQLVILKEKLQIIEIH
jgi:hypothetical protein